MLKYWLITILLITFSCGLTYATVQHVLRTGANDPQIQIAEDTAANLAKGQSPQAAIANTKIAIDKSLATFVIIYKNNQSVASSALLDGETPQLPSGVFASAKQTGVSRLTWQPKAGVRIAAVVIPFTFSDNAQGFVLAGRSLREVEKREDDLLIEVSLLWIGTVAITTIIWLAPAFRKHKKIDRKKNKRM